MNGRVKRPTAKKTYELLIIQLPHGILIRWPLKPTILQTLIQQKKAVSVPVKSFEAVLSGTAEEIERLIVWIKIELLLNNAGQSVNPTTKIGFTTDDVDLSNPTWINEHY